VSPEHRAYCGLRTVHVILLLCRLVSQTWQQLPVLVIVCGKQLNRDSAGSEPTRLFGNLWATLAILLKLAGIGAEDSLLGFLCLFNSLEQKGTIDYGIE
jgi:hypothetical protein